MDINDLRAAFSVIMFVLLAGIYVWAWSRNRKSDFNEAANLPFAEPDQPAPMASTKPRSTVNNSGEKL